jgi:type VI secretion system secreted protein Hcp
MIWQLHVTIEGQRGRIRGEVGDPKLGRLSARTYASAIRSLRDTAAGTGGGRRQHQPLTFCKDVGPATPQLAQAACTGEVLRSVLFEFVRATEGGQEEVFFAVRLHDATISGHRLTMPDANGDQPLGEEIDLTYRRIEWEHRLAKTMAADEWA